MIINKNYVDKNTNATITAVGKASIIIDHNGNAKGIMTITAQNTNAVLEQRELNFVVDRNTNQLEQVYKAFSSVFSTERDDRGNIVGGWEKYDNNIANSIIDNAII